MANLADGKYQEVFLGAALVSKKKGVKSAFDPY